MALNELSSVLSATVCTARLSYEDGPLQGARISDRVIEALQKHGMDQAVKRASPPWIHIMDQALNLPVGAA